MLRELHIKNLAIIDDITISFGKGLNVLTGETGVGKSIIIDALCLVLGERASGELIRSGEKEAVVEAFFDIPQNFLPKTTQGLLSDMGIDPEDGIITKRVISSEGRGRAYINNSMVTAQALSEVSKDIIDIHGQYEHQSLLSPENQLILLDNYAGLMHERQEVASIYESLTGIKNQITEITNKEKERAQRVDLLEFQVNEIESANLKAHEEQELQDEEKVLGSSSRLMELAHEAYEAIYSSEGAALTRLTKALNALNNIAGIDSRAKEAVNSLQSAMPLIEDAAYFLRDYKESLNFDPQRLALIQERLELIKALKRKYGSDIGDILLYHEKARGELEGLQNSEEKLEGLKAEHEKLKKLLTEKAASLSRKRKATTKKIEPLVISELSKLSMPNTKFSVSITHESGDATNDGFKADSAGIDKVEYLISPNVGEELKPLSKIASGGELSRIMLALKGILSGGDRVPVLVFDEIDAGVGGKAAETVGQKLKNLSKTKQVVCITHLAQIASFGDRHLRIEKNVRDKRTTVEIKELKSKDRIEEIARMLSGSLTEVSIKHAEELLSSKGL
ncbi:MAG: DNA repair protein RecN [Nitrospirae bacterium]|nr:DNA repair protein RecN [Nitrospirota bacterium]